MTAPQIQYFQPPGPFLPPSRWRRGLRGWVWPVSVLAALVLTAVTVTVLILGIDRATSFTASGAVHVDCQTRQAVDGRPIGNGAPVRLYRLDDRTPIATTTLNKRRDFRAGEGACYQGFVIDDVRVDGGDYLLQVGDLPGRLVSRAQLEAGVSLDR